MPKNRKEIMKNKFKVLKFRYALVKIGLANGQAYVKGSNIAQCFKSLNNLSNRQFHMTISVSLACFPV